MQTIDKRDIYKALQAHEAKLIVLTAAQHDALHAYREAGSFHGAGYELGKNPSTVRDHVLLALRKLRDAGLELRTELPERDAPPRCESVRREPVDPVAAQRKQAQDRDLKGQNDNLAKRIVTLEDNLEMLTRLTGSPLPPVRRIKLKKGKREGTAVALLSDWHVETEIRPGDVPTGNVFNLDVADTRIARTFSAIAFLIDTVRYRSEVNTLVLWLGGDFITNYLHDENVETAQLGPTSSVLWVQSRIIRGIETLLEFGLKRIDVVCSYGNHGRTTKTMRAATSADHSWEWLMYQAIASYFRDDSRVTVLADRSAHQYHRVYDFDLHFHHGHDVRYGGGVGGIMIPINKAVSQWQRARACHFHNFGHFHQYLSVGGVNVNGSLIGFDPYAMSIKAAPEPARQSFYLLDQSRGQTMSCPIWCEENEKGP